MMAGNGSISVACWSIILSQVCYAITPCLIRLCRLNPQGQIHSYSLFTAFVLAPSAILFKLGSSMEYHILASVYFLATFHHFVSNLAGLTIQAAGVLISTVYLNYGTFLTTYITIGFIAILILAMYSTIYYPHDLCPRQDLITILIYAVIGYCCYTHSVFSYLFFYFYSMHNICYMPL